MIDCILFMQGDRIIKVILGLLLFFPCSVLAMSDEDCMKEANRIRKVISGGTHNLVDAPKTLPKVGKDTNTRIVLADIYEDLAEHSSYLYYDLKNKKALGSMAKYYHLAVANSNSTIKEFLSRTYYLSQYTEEKILNAIKEP